MLSQDESITRVQSDASQLRKSREHASTKIKLRLPENRFSHISGRFQKYAKLAELCLGLNTEKKNVF